MDFESALSIVKGRDGWNEWYEKVSEFKRDLGKEEEDAVGHEELKHGRIFWEKKKQQILLSYDHWKIQNVLKYVGSKYEGNDYMIQFWGDGKVDGSLITSSFSFLLGSNLWQGHSWYRQLTSDHVYNVGDELGPVGRAYRSKLPESTPDLRLYSSHEFPLRDETARCGYRAYMVLPLLDLDTNHCYGVLEFLSPFLVAEKFELFAALDQGLQGQPEREFVEIFELAVKNAPMLSLMQLMVPCGKCANTCCMQMKWFIDSHSRTPNTFSSENHFFSQYLIEAAAYCHQQVDTSVSRSNLCEDAISNNPLAHYAQYAKLSHCFAVSLNNRCTIRFFLDPSCREDAYSDCGQQLLLRIMETNLKSFKIVEASDTIGSSRSLGGGGVNVIKSSGIDADLQGLLFNESLFGNHLQCIPIPMKEIIETVMSRIKGYVWNPDKWIVQCWAPKMVNARLCLVTANQPYVVSDASGMLPFRMKCVAHRYLADDEAKKEDLGPPGRVFRNRKPEITSDLFNYSAQEFPMTSFAVCGFTESGYFAFPVFDVANNNKCEGVLEFIGFPGCQLRRIATMLEAAKLCSAAIDFSPPILRLPENDSSIRRDALAEICNVLQIIDWDIPQLEATHVWVRNGKCISVTDTNVHCMELALSYTYYNKYVDADDVHTIHVRSRKGIVGSAMASENKAYFCPSLYEFGIDDQPLFERRKSSSACFAVCLQSSHTGGLVYVMEFFLYPGPSTYSYVRSFLELLLPIMKHELKSFKMASGKQLGEELVVEVIASEERKLIGSDSDAAAMLFPVRFKRMQYGEQSKALTMSSHISGKVWDFNITENRKRKRGLNLSLEDLKPHFGKRLKDVAIELGCYQSAIRTAYKKLGLERWPTREDLLNNPFLSQGTSFARTTTSGANP
ncbi:protein NLP6-like isoform X2 [Salvia splendens]|uniref:protein NLP6-like isoform X2 n=1 Tax=Salvia splendens TaxID=180675 RepID=UPI001C26BE08|nr:protein NLP6-like isoform X2 [Salvia splendens]